MKTDGERERDMYEEEMRERERKRQGEWPNETMQRKENAPE